jgi:hypothetical protein
MEYLLFVVEKRTLTNTPDDFAYIDTREELRRFQERTPDVEYLGENVLLIPQDQKTDLVAEIRPLLRGLRAVQISRNSHV